MAKIDLSKPLYDQETYVGRLKHFVRVTNPLNLFASSAQLEEAKTVVEAFKKSGSMPAGYDEDKLWSMKYLYDSAFHPDTGEKVLLVGRMSAQAPMNTMITGCMITFYKTTAATVFWQWVNQTFNALVNYSNRSGTTPIPPSQLLASYVGACGGALGTALYLNSKTKRMKPIFARLVPFAAVSCANFINIPMMRSSEIINGTTIFTQDGKEVGLSTRAGILGIGMVCVSRVIMAVPGMTLTPMLTNYAYARGVFCERPRMVLPFQLGLVGLCVLIATPLCCALFKQNASIPVSRLEQPVQDQVKKQFPKEEYVFFNKGL